ncbi:MAG: hypothetical protein ACXACX_11315 [Candidatus Hodarchaeales archaeon]
MIIKELYVISKAGLCRFHYKASFSDYEIDETLFAGFIAALQTFTDSMAKVQIEYLAMQEDQIHLVSVEDIIIVAIMSITGAEQKIIDQLLTFIGKKFVDNYKSYLERPNFQWDSIVEDFTKQIEFIWADKEVYEEAKRGLISELFDKVIRKQVSADILQWKITSLFINSPDREKVKTIEKVEKLHAMVPRLVTDPILESEINESIQKSVEDLSKALPKKRRFLIVYCEDGNMYDIIFNKALGMNFFCIPVRAVSDISGIVYNWNEESPYNILYLAHTISEEELNALGEFSTPEKRAYLWLEEIPTYAIKYRLKHFNTVIVKQTPEFGDIIGEILKEKEIRIDTNLSQDESAVLQTPK